MRRDDYISIIPQRLTEALKAAGTTMEELGKQISKSKQAVSLYCNGKTRPTNSTLAEIAQIINVSVDYLTGASDVPPIAIVEYRQKSGAKKDTKSYQKKYREKNRDRINAKKREWIKNNPDKQRAYRNKWRKQNPEKEKARKEQFFEKEVSEAISAFEYKDGQFTDKCLISVKEMSEILGINILSGYWLVKQEGFPSERISNRNIVIIVEKFKQWLKIQIAKNN